MTEQKRNIRQILSQVFARLLKFRKYVFPGFLVLVGLIYAILFFRINSLVNQQPSDTAVTSQVKAAKVPHIDEAVVEQLQSLQDNSVSVQSLIDEARSNPFQ
jgi:hypothetical protein